ncbi:MAG: hypothetical protein ABIT05_14095 [Chitinophagaceae bacterium]
MKTTLIVIIALVSFSTIQAQDRYFARTYTSNVLPKGAVDLEFWHTSRFGHLNQFYHAQDQRMEIEVGLGNKVQTAFYFNRFQTRFSTTNDGTETSNEIGFSNEWKWKIKNQTKHLPAIALYGEWGIKGGDEIELETKLIADRWFGKSLITFNAVTEYEREFSWKNGRLQSNEWTLPVEFDLAYMYNLKPGLGIGFEISNQNRISAEGWEHSVIFGGPTLNFRGSNWFVIANYLPQWGNVHKTSIAPFNKVLDEHERTEARILLGISILN